MSTPAGQEENEEPIAQPGFVNIQVNNQNGKSVFFRVKRDLELKKLITTYRAKQSVDKSVVFLFDGRRIGAKETPNDLGMEDTAVIEVMVNQNGGAPALLN